MTDNFRDWAFGLGIFLTAAFVLFLTGRFISPYSHFSFLECWGIVMLLVVLRSGYISYNEDDEDDA